MATKKLITWWAGAGSGTWIVPADWNSADNAIEVLAPGGGGRSSTSGGAGGGGGGQYRKLTNLTLTPGDPVSWFIGARGTAGLNGGDTGFNGTTTGTASVWAQGGRGATSVTGALGGSASTTGTGFNGGAGGLGGATGVTGGGGGGAAGPGGVGGVGGAGDNSASGADFGGSGGGGAGLTGPGGPGGAGGTSAGAAGAAGAGGGGAGGLGGSGGGSVGGGATGVWFENGPNYDNPDIPSSGPFHWTAPGGGGGGGGSAAGSGGNPADYGGGGGGAGNGTGGTGAPGLIVVSYTPVETPPVTVTGYCLSESTSDIGSQRELKSSGATAGSWSGQVLASYTGVSRTFYAPAGDPGANGQSIATIYVGLMITTGVSACRYFARAFRVDATGIVKATSEWSPGTLSGASGYYILAVDGVHLGTWASGDRLRIDVRIHNGGGVGGQSVTLDYPGAYSPSGVHVAWGNSTAKWNYADISTGYTLTNGELTATYPSGSTGYRTGRATVRNGSDKVYCEITVTDYVADAHVGVAGANESLNDTYLGKSVNSVGLYNTGTAYYNNGIIGVSSGFVDGDIVSIAYDDTNKSIWFRTGGGNWNNSGTANPATNTGGYSCASLPTGGVFPAFGGKGPAYSDTLTANLGATAYAYTPTIPTGFTNWDGSAIGAAGLTGTVTEAATAVANQSVVFDAVASRTEIATAADVLSAALVTAAARTETVTAADTPTGGLLQLGALTETASTASVESAALATVASRTEAATTATTQTATTGYAVSRAEAANAAEALATTAVITAGHTEAATITASQTLGAISAERTETATTADTQTALQVHAAPRSELASAVSVQDASGLLSAARTEAASTTSTQSAIVAVPDLVRVETASATDSVAAVLIATEARIETASATDSAVATLPGLGAPIFVKHTGVWKPATLHVKHEGVWKQPVRVYVKDAGVWQQL